MNEIIIATAVLSGMGLVFGVSLAYASKVFAVVEDERVMKVRALLPGANCGACGYAGCDGLAAALVAGTANLRDCPVGGEDVAEKIALVLGMQVDKSERRVARVLCAGTNEVSREKFTYSGIADCFAAAQIFAGFKSCSYGCLGYGNCQRACPFGAIIIRKRVALIDEAKCKSCGICIETCPKALIEMVPVAKRYLVLCKSKDKGGVTKKNCGVGCIGCTRCVKECPVGAISMVGTLAKINPAMCTNCGKCVEVCPTHAIVKM